MGVANGRHIRRMPSGIVLHPRQCRNAEPHAPHSWRGLNTRHAGYFCEGQPSDLQREPSERFAETFACGCEWHAGQFFPCAIHRDQPDPSSPP